MILVCGGLADVVTEVVCARLEACGFPYRLIDLGVYPNGYDVEWRWDGGSPTGWIETRDWRLDLDDLSGVYVRYLGPEGREPLPGVPPAAVPALYAEYDAGLAALFEDLPCLVVNRLTPGLSNHSKAYQAQLIREQGLDVPATLVTNDPAQVRAFYDEHHGEVVYKSLSGVRSIVRRLGEEQLARLPLLDHGPAQFQAYVPGDNVRVHTVGGDLFATRVRSTAVDYRYARSEGGETVMAPEDLPPAIAEACLRVADALDLTLTGIDLKVTPEGEYFCFEVNPSPGFLYYEQHTGQPISAALASLLRNGLDTRITPPRPRPPHAGE